VWRQRFHGTLQLGIETGLLRGCAEPFRRGQLTLFMRGDELEAAWEWVEPTLEYWDQDDTTPAPYTSGTWGPAAASALIGRDGLQWREEALPED